MEKRHYTVQELGKILGVWAHPDDETYSCGGIMALASKQGQGIGCITATKGEGGIQDESRWPSHKLSEIREQELKAAMDIIGANYHCWLGYRDGECSAVDSEEAIKKIQNVIDEFRPNTILTFGPDGMTGHPDHQTVSRWATEAGAQNNIRVMHAVMTPEAYQANIEADRKYNMFFNIKQPPIVEAELCALHLRLDDETLQTKCEALRAMESQTARMIEDIGMEKLLDMTRIEAFVLAR